MVTSRVLLVRGAITSDMSAGLVPLTDMLACTVQHYQTCMLGSFIQIHVLVKCCSIMQGIWSVTNLSDMPTNKVLLPWVCKFCQATINDAVLNISIAE